ncbi:MAG: dienelactone hydrolase family protein [Proteobacteria bacterium]|nr:dienelactone hydrolase family protein [Pseudomonadota bacterium]
MGQRQLALPDGREIALWYPAASDAKDARIAACAARWPLVLFSHGVFGCNEQAIYITQEIARHGYIVAAPNHRDAICGIATRRTFPSPPDSDRPAFLDPAIWKAKAWRERMLDLRDTLRSVQADPELGRAIDFDRIGLMGHSLGGYTVLGMAGGWPGWGLSAGKSSDESRSRVRAVLAFSPFVQPFLAQRRLRELRVPVMYQGGSLDFGMTPNLVRAGGAYDVSRAPKYLVEFAAASHLLWTNLPCDGYARIAACLAAVPNARGVDAYALAFLDRYLKAVAAPLLDGKGDGLRAYRFRR